jgi:hypothetical protein
MTYTLSVQTNDVTGFNALTYTHHGPRTHCGYLFAARHELHVFIEDGDFQSVAGSDGSSTLLRVSLNGRIGMLTLRAPDFTESPQFPFERKAVQRKVDVAVSGDAILRRSGTSPVRYQVVVGMLRCAFVPMFEALRAQPGKPSALASFWPSLPRSAEGLDYLFTPLGLALEGALDLRAPQLRDVLLLPRHQPGAEDGDVAWRAIPDSEKKGTHTWQKLDTPPVAAKPAFAALVDALRADAPDPGAWPVTEPRWAVLRWRLMTPGRQPFLEHCCRNAASAVRLERTDPGSSSSVHADLVCQMWVSVGHAGAQVEHGGMVCSLSGADMTAQLVWDARERNSMFTARTARSALWLAGADVAPPAGLFSVVRQTLRTAVSADRAAPNLVLEWARDQQPSGAQLTLAPTGMLCGGALAGAAGIEPPVPDPSWLMLEEGCLQFEPGTLPLDKPDMRPAQALLAAAADSSQVFRGGLPLAALGGPAGLTAWVSGGRGRADPDVVLSIDSFSVKLQLHDAILVWRTPGWWACAADRQQGELRLPPLGAPFVEALAAAPADPGDTARKLHAAMAAVMFPVLWVGRAGEPATNGWSLDIDRAGSYRFVIPPAAVRATVLWSAFRDAYLVQTIPAGGQALGGPLLDAMRALQPIAHHAGEALELIPGTSGLPRLAKPRYPSPPELAAGWEALGGEYFHPNITGLTLNPASASYTYRHGPPILADGYLRARLDGSFGSTPASSVLGAVRPSDDVAIDTIALAPKQTTSYQVRGWLAATQTVAVSKLALELGGLDPHMSMEAAGGANGAERLALRIGSSDDGFVDPVVVVADGAGTTSYLSREVKHGKLLRNFGQSLAVDDAAHALRDGSGRSWTPFADGKRTLSVAGVPGSRDLLTQQRHGVLDCGVLGAAELSLCLADVDPAAPGHSGSWDLSGPLEGHAGSQPMLGPFVLLPDELRSVGTDMAVVKARLGVPAGDPGLPPIESAAGVALHWKAATHGWDLELDPGAAFEWRIAAAPGPDPCVANVGGTLAMRGSQLALVVNRVSLHTGIGEVSLPCKEAPLDYTFEDGICTALAATVEADDRDGLEADFILHYRFRAHDGQSIGWHIGGAHGEPQLRWVDGEGGALVLELGAGKAGALRFSGASGRAHVLTLAQASTRHWLALAQASGGVELAGCLERDDGRPGHPVQLRLAYRWTGPLADAEAVFGPLGAGSRVRVDGSASWRSKGWGGNAEPPLRELSGHLVLDNDYAFAFAQHAGASVTMVDRVHCYFDRLPLDARGGVAGGVLHAMVEHRFHTGTGDAPVFAFQVPQAIGLKAARDGRVGMSANAVIMLRAGAKAAHPPEVVPQVLYEPEDGPDEILGACLGPATERGLVGGMLLRLPLRTGVGSAVLKVPAPRLPELAWLPLVAPPETGPRDTSSPWHERRALAHALDAAAVARLCGAPANAGMAGSAALPGDGDTLNEWSALSEAHGWLHSGLLSNAAGVWATPYYAGIPTASRDTGPESAIPATLYVADAAVQGGLRRAAHALVAGTKRPAAGGSTDADSGALLEWGRGEMLRRSLRTSALVIAHGRPALSVPVFRPFVIAAVDDEVLAAPLLPDAALPRHSALIELLRPAEAPAEAPPIARQVLSARTDQDAVVEVVDAQPLVVRHEPALRFRLALNHIVADAGRHAEVSAQGAALSKRQRIVFAEPEEASPQPRNVLPLLAPPGAPTAQLVSPALVDVCCPALRPGDTVYTRWALSGEGAETGPGVEPGLRSPRAGNSVGDSAVVLDTDRKARADVDGVGWALQGVTAARPLGHVEAPIVDTGIEVTVVTPRESAHRLVALQAAPGAGKLSLGVAAYQADDEENAEAACDLSLRLLEPLFCGAFPHGLDGLLPAGSELAWAVAAGDRGRGHQDPVLPAEVFNVEEISASARARDIWNAGEQVRVVRLGGWQSLADRPGHEQASSRPDGYSLEPGANIARLLRLTHKERNAPRHWLLKEGLAAGPLLVLLIRSGTSLRYLVAFALDWRRGAALEQPERVLAVRGGQVLGFGDLAGPAGIRLEDGRFVLYKTAYALDLAARDEDTMPARAWLFGPGGACTAITPAR